jgi:hypothetical protein
MGYSTMAKTNEHGRLIAAAAKAALLPLGCQRKGQSRVWYSDQRYWVIAVEFQPSGWSKGSYLNISVGWLWKESRGYGLSYRPVDFIPFESVEQFTPPIFAMAASAAKEVVILREKFKSFSNIYSYLKSNANSDSWPIYHAAIACGLAGDLMASRHYFDQMAAWPTYGYDWQLKLKADSAALAPLLDEPAKFRSAILAIIEKRRRLIRLPPDPHCLDELDSIAAL